MLLEVYMPRARRQPTRQQASPSPSPERDAGNDRGDSLVMTTAAGVLPRSGDAALGCWATAGWLAALAGVYYLAASGGGIGAVLAVSRGDTFSSSVAAAAAAASFVGWVYCSDSAPALLLRCVLRMAAQRGRRQPGELSGIAFPVRVEQLTSSPNGPRDLTAMLRHSGGLPATVSVVSIVDTNTSIVDGVKGDKAIIEVRYDSETSLPQRLFVKFNLRGFGAMRLLCESTVRSWHSAQCTRLGCALAWLLLPPGP